MRVKEKKEKTGLKLNIKKTKIMASSPNTSWQIDGETMETKTLFSWTSKSLQMVTAAMKLKDTCSLDGKLGRHHFADKICIVKAMVFPVVMYECES